MLKGLALSELHPTRTIRAAHPVFQDSKGGRGQQGLSAGMTAKAAPSEQAARVVVIGRLKMSKNLRG